MTNLMSMTFKEVAEILKIIDASDCDEVSLELEGFRLSVRRGGHGVAGPAPVSPPPHTGSVSAEKPSSGAAPAASKPGGDTAKAPGDTGGLVEVRSAMLGTFYRRPSPDEAAFVETGDKIAAGDPLCLIEVMKLFTTIEAPAAGTVARICVEDGALIEFDQLLFLIDPQG